MSPNGRKRCAYGLIEFALLRTMAGQTWEQISVAIGSALSSGQRRLALHHRLLEEDPAYAMGAAEIGTAALGASCPERGGEFG